MIPIGVVSDLHHGSIFGLLPPDFVTSAGDVRQQNPGQAYLWKCWLRACAWLKACGVQAVVVNGEFTDGDQRAQRGTELCLNIFKDQMEAAAVSMKLLMADVGDIPFFAVQGTEYHDQPSGQALDGLAESLGFVKYSGMGTGKYSKEVLDLDIDGVIINFAHHISVSSGLYRATAPDREALWSALAGKEGKYPKTDCLVRSHAHYFVHLEHATKHAIITPCWQLQTRFMRRHSVYRMAPDIGAIVIWVDPEAKKDGRDPIHRVEKLLFPLPQIIPTKLKSK